MKVEAVDTCPFEQMRFTQLWWQLIQIRSDDTTKKVSFVQQMNLKER